jgi:hydroxylamine dehydrogenase
MSRISLLLVPLALIGILPATAAEGPCVTCHRQETPFIVQDWENSRHQGMEVGCATCHGDEHTSATDTGRFS